MLAAFARHTLRQTKCSMAFGFGTAAGSAGMFVFAPISQGLIDAYGWSDSLGRLAVTMLAIIPVLAILLLRQLTRCHGNAQPKVSADSQLALR